ncbi:MAG: dicarboxylate/amino acid:cation symporter [Bacteroidales bacterium]
MNKIFSSTIFRLFLGVIAGITIGSFIPESAVGAILSLRHVLGQVIFFLVPLIVIGFVAPSIARLREDASSMLSKALLLAYGSTIGAGFFAVLLGYKFLPGMDIASVAESTKSLPEMIFRLDIPPVMGVMSALVLSIMLGLATVWTKSELFGNFLNDFQQIVLSLVNRILIPLLPSFIAANFAVLAYEGAITQLLPIFIKVMGIVIIAHFIWLGLLYTVAGIKSGKNPWEVLKHYGPAYLTAVGTMSSAATLGIALSSAQKSKVLSKDISSFSVPLFANIHLCGSVLTEVFFVMTVSLIIYGTLPSASLMILFVLLLGIFGIGAPGVPGGTVVASLGLIISVLGFTEVATALLLTIFALQDSFGTACNITGDGALTLMLQNKDAETVETETSGS